MRKLIFYKETKLMFDDKQFTDSSIIMTREVADRLIYITLPEVRAHYKSGRPGTYRSHWSGKWQLLDWVRDDFAKFLPEQFEKYKQAPKKWPLMPSKWHDESTTGWCVEDSDPKNRKEFSFRILIANRYSNWIRNYSIYAQVLTLRASAPIYLTTITGKTPFGLVMPMKP